MVFRFGIVVGLAALAGCSSDSNDIEVADLAGAYTATKLEFVLVADPSTKVDVITAGITMDFVITAGGDFDLAVHTPGEADELDSGTIELDGNQITLQNSDPASGTFALNGDVLTLHLTTGVEFDFDNNGTDDPAILNIVLHRT